MKVVFFFLIFFNLSVFCFSQEELSENIDFLSIEPDSHVVFNIEGDFTNSGLIEKVFFYKWDSKRAQSIHSAYCILFTDDNHAVKAYKIPYYGTLPFSKEHNLLSMPIMEVLGKSIDWSGYSIGRFGDFNGNGREELYFFSLQIGFAPEAYEFNPQKQEFEMIMGNGYTSFFRVLKIDEKQKKIILEARGGEGGEASRTKIIYLQWNDETYRYVEYEPDAEEQTDAEELMIASSIKIQPIRLVAEQEKDTTQIEKSSDTSTDSDDDLEDVQETEVVPAGRKTFPTQVVVIIIGIIALAVLARVFLKKKKEK